MDRDVKENVQLKGDGEVPAQPHLGKAEDALTPRCSTDTLFNFDISSDIPKFLFPMDAEDSPWGGMYSSQDWCSIWHCN